MTRMNRNVDAVSRSRRPREPLFRPKDARRKRRRRACCRRARRVCARRPLRRFGRAGCSCAVRPRARTPAAAGARRRGRKLGREGPGSDPARRARRPRQLDRRGWARSAPAGRRHAPGRSLPGRQHREAVRRRHRVAARRAAAASRSTPRSPTCSPPMWSTASRPHPGSRFGCCSATEAASPTGAPRPRTSPPPVIPPGSGRCPSSLDLAAAKKPLFAPGTRYAYSNTEYTLLGLVIEHATGRSWQQEVTDRVIRPLGLGATVLPAAGNRSWMGPYAHGYLEVNGKVLDVSSVDPSMAGAAGGHALVTTGGDLVRFLDALLAGRLFRRPETLRQMLTFAPAPDVRRPGRLRPRDRTTRGTRWHRPDRPSRRGGWLLRLRRPAATPTGDVRRRDEQLGRSLAAPLPRVSGARRRTLSMGRLQLLRLVNERGGRWHPQRIGLLGNTKYRERI